MRTTQTRSNHGPDTQAINRKKILLSNDLDLFLELKRISRNEDDLDMLSTGSGAEAYAMARYYHPDMVFLDLKMNEIDGDECCWQIKHNPELCSIPVTMVVENRRSDGLKRCQEAGCDQILTKPLDPEQLAATLRRYQGGIERTEPRIKARLRVRFGQNQKLLTGYSVNLSTGGLFLQTADPLPAETSLDLEFDLGNGSPIISCQGRVAWVNLPDQTRQQRIPPGMGVQFLNLSLEAMAKIENFVQRSTITPTW